MYSSDSQRNLYYQKTIHKVNKVTIDLGEITYATMEKVMIIVQVIQKATQVV